MSKTAMDVLREHFGTDPTEISDNVSGFYEESTGQLIMINELAAASPVKGEEGAEKVTPISFSKNAFARQCKLSDLFENLPDYSGASPVGFRGTWAMGGYITCYLRPNPKKKAKKKSASNAIAPALGGKVSEEPATLSLEDELD